MKMYYQSYKVTLLSGITLELKRIYFAQLQIFTGCKLKIRVKTNYAKVLIM